MHLFPKNMSLILLFTIIWCILNEKFTVPTILGGIVVSFVTFIILGIIQPNNKKTYSYDISVLRMLFFILLLIKDIYQSAFRTIRHLIKNEINPQFVVTSTRIRRPWIQALIGNAVTLTPGTVTVHMSEGSYTILWLYPLSIRQKEIKKQLIQDFENALITEDHNA